MVLFYFLYASNLYLTSNNQQKREDLCDLPFFALKTFELTKASLVYIIPVFTVVLFQQLRRQLQKAARWLFVRL